MPSHLDIADRQHHQLVDCKNAESDQHDWCEIELQEIPVSLLTFGGKYYTSEREIKHRERERH